MFRQIRSSMLVGMTICVLIGDNRPAVAAPVREVSHGERYKNDTGETVYSMKKYLYQYNVVQNAKHWPESDKFAVCNWMPVSGDYSVIRCTGADLDHSGMVEHGQTAEVKFYVYALPETAEVLCAKWYRDANWTVFQNYATPVASPKGAVAEVRGEEFTVKIVLKNEAREWVGEDPNPGAPGDDLGTISGSEIYYAEWRENLHERDMTEVLWTCVSQEENEPPVGPGTECWDDSDCNVAPYLYCGRYDEDEQCGITWVHPVSWPANFVLASGGDTNPDFMLPGTYKGTDRILFRFYTDLAHVYGTSDYEVMQFRVRDIIPTVSEWGLVVIALLVLAAGTIVIRRRRAMAAQA